METPKLKKKKNTQMWMKSLGTFMRWFFRQSYQT